MKTIYVQCSMGVAGDMLMGALYELLDEDGQKAFLKKMNSLAIPGLSVSAIPAVRCGVTGTHMEVKINGVEEMEGGHHHHHAHGHAHNGIKDIREIIKSLDVSEPVKRNASAIYDIIAAAESKVHGHAMEHIHFHEVGSLDAVADVIGNCLLMEMLGADSVQSSPICVGSGTVKCAHGILPVPAPATALILNGIPIYSGEIKTELCTPTGAALMKYFSENFGEMPSMTTEKVGYGMGTKEFPGAANCVRAVLGNAGASFTSSNNDSTDSVYELCANIDDMTGEEIGFAMEMLLECGALDVWTEAITMKKSRPAVKLCVLARGIDRKRMIECIFKHTTTLGVREQVYSRYVLKRCEQKQKTELGEVRVKFASGFGVTRGKYEYDDLARIAREKGMSIRQVREMIGGVQLKSTDAE